MDREDKGGYRSEEPVVQGLGTPSRPDQAGSGLALLSLPRCTSEAGVWVLLGRVGSPPFPDAGTPQPILPASCPSSSPPNQPI